MIIVVEGTKKFDDYETFMRAMGVALSQQTGGNVIDVWSVGPHKINSFTAAFCNSAENYLKQKGFKINFKKVPHSFVSDNINSIGYLAFFSLRKEPSSRLVVEAELSGKEIGIFRV
jgi:hypothetical protein